MGKAEPRPYVTMAKVLVAVILACVLNAGVTAGLVYNFKAQIDSSNHASQVQGEKIGQRLCTTLNKLSVLAPPTGSPINNPSRAYEQELHTTLDQLGPDIGCPG